jgi:type IV pilus assembly protein PilE
MPPGRDDAPAGGGRGRARAPAQGFTLVEASTVLAVAAVLAAVAWPNWQDQLHQGRRMDGRQALAQLQHAQELYRSHHGLYATELPALRGMGDRSPQGHYRIELERHEAQAYRARAVAQGAQRRDAACAELTLEVTRGFVRQGPAARCWQR